MPAPTNISAGTAIDLGSLPADVTQDVAFGGVNYTVWYKFTAPAGAVVVGVWGFSAIANVYRSYVTPYSDAGITAILPFSTSNRNKPCQFAVIPGHVYYLEFVKNGDTAPASLEIRAEVASDNVPNGNDIIINDDTTGYPLAIVDGTTDYTIRKFYKDIASGDAGDIVYDSPNAILLDDQAAVEFKLYDLDFNIIVHVAYLNLGTGLVRANQTSKIIYYCNSGGFAGQVRGVRSDGTLTSTIYTLADSSVGAIAVNDNESIIYYSLGTGGAVKTYTVSGGVTATFLAGVANVEVDDILYLSDGTLIMSHFNTVTHDLTIKHYSQAAAVLNTYSLGTDFTATAPRLGYATDNTSFWVYTHVSSVAGKQQLFNIEIATGTILTTRLISEYNQGRYQPVESATPNGRFGTSNSCPIMAYPSDPGMFVVVEDKRTDSDGTGTVAIPDPTFKTGLMP